MIKSTRRLAELFAPAHYTILLDISTRIARTFAGTVTITGALRATSPAITLHAQDLTITKAMIDNTPVTWRNGDHDELILTAKGDLNPGDHTLTLEFHGAITDPMQGLYPCYFTLNGTPKELLMTQLESHSARQLFPCIDEPAAKATFTLTLRTEPDITVLSNTPVAKQITENDILITSFETTPKMSTYLLALVAGELAYKETTNQHGVTIRAYATPDKTDQLGFALEYASKMLDFYDDYFGVPFPLPKCDIVACPDFSAGAMENWGLVTFREAAMLVDDQDTPPDTRQYIATVVAHELAHQWFGNLVTMQWWDYLWLNESFANWMEYYATAQFHPEWQLWEQTGATEKQIALARDGLASVQAVEQHINSPEEIGSLFDPAIVYAKGGSLIHMLHDYLGDDTFRQGMRIYMQRHKYGNTTSKDLWDALSEASGKDVSSFMQPWISQPGHPVLDVASHDGHITVSQRRFFANPLEADHNDSAIWPAPLLAPSLPDAEVLTAKSQDFVVSPAPYHLLNQGATGFYHTHYDAETVANLAKAVANSKLSALDRQRLLLDSIALNRAGISATTETLALLENYHHESNYAVWLAISAALGAVRTLVNEDDHLKPHLQRLVVKISHGEFARLGWEPKTDEPYFDALLRPTIIANMAYAEDSRTLAECLRLFDAAKKPGDIPSDIRSIVYSVAVRERGKPAVNQLLQWYAQTTSADERVNLCAGISSVRDGELAKDSLALLTTKAIKLQDVFYWFIYHIRNRDTRQQTWQWMVDNWGWIQQKFGGDAHDYGSFAKYSGGALSTTEELAMYKDFFEPKLNELSIARTIRQGIEDIQIRALWRERDLTSISAYLAKVSQK